MALWLTAIQDRVFFWHPCKFIADMLRRERDFPVDLTGVMCLQDSLVRQIVPFGNELPCKLPFSRLDLEFGLYKCTDKHA